MSDDLINLTIDGKPVQAKRGQMLIEVTDAAGIDVPRFCYHKKLSVAANCRMCLVEVEKAPKPLPACATPVMPDMVVKTRSQLALEAQQGTMEFLLINHPLDCPICDQGGECELQDVAMGYGGSASQYTEGKRVVMDKYIGPLIATEMTRCIHCTRCVRFGEEVAGVRELGATGRGENVRIGTYIEKSVASEVSGNVIDICPVGALTARPSRYTARAWELQQSPSVAPHDSIGSNIFVHVDNGKINRVVPRENESINEVWISDRDRFSYQGLRSSDRLLSPKVRRDGELVDCDWQTALSAAKDAIESGAQAGDLGVLASASCTLEELYLLQKLARELGTDDIDHRLSQSDFSGDAAAPVMPWLGMNIDDLESLDSALVIGSNIRKELPIAALRLRKSALNGGRISFLNPLDFPLHFDPSVVLVPRYDQLVEELYMVALAAGADLSGLRNAPASLQPSERHQEIAKELKNGERSAVLIGSLAACHPAYATLCELAAALSKQCNATFSYLPSLGNACGAWLAGVVPHRRAGGKALGSAGRHAGDMLAKSMNTYLMMGVEAEFDAADPVTALQSLGAAKNVVYISSFLSDSMAEHATVVLPAAAFTETYSTYVNVAGQWQSSKGIVEPPGEARPAWKILRVLADQFELAEFQYNNPEQITREIQGKCDSVELNNLAGSSMKIDFPGSSNNAGLLRVGEIPIHRRDPLVRRSVPLQKSSDGKQVFASMCQLEMQRHKIQEGDQVTISLSQADNGGVTLPVKLDDGVPENCVWVPGGLSETAVLGPVCSAVEIKA